jgi:hypothetical protein
VDDDPDAIRLEPGVGWVADVTFNGGPLDQEGPVACRISSRFATSGGTGLDPISRGCEVLVVLSEGDPNASPTIVGQVHNAGGCELPGSVNGLSIDEALALVTHILKTPHGLEEEYGGDIRVATPGTHRLLGQLIELAELGATQSYVRGDTFAAALTALLAVVAAESTAAASAAGALGGIPVLSPAAPALTAWGTAATATATAVQDFLARLATPGDLLSLRIKGE